MYPVQIKPVTCASQVLYVGYIHTYGGVYTVNTPKVRQYFSKYFKWGTAPGGSNWQATTAVSFSPLEPNGNYIYHRFHYL
jgi:hypothetical protein